MKIVTMQTRARGTVTVIRTIDYKKFVSGCEYLLDIVTCQLLTGAQEEGALPTVHLTGHTLFTLAAIDISHHIRDYFFEQFIWINIICCKHFCLVR